MKSPNFYAETGLDRMAERRPDAEWLLELSRDAAAMVVPIWRTHNLIDQAGDAPQAGRLAGSMIAGLVDQGGQLIFLGFRDAKPYFAIDLSHIDEPHELPELAGAGEFADLRDLSLTMPREDGGMLAYVRALSHWHRTHQFCGRCGAKTEMIDAGHVRRCTNSACNAQHFPRTDAAVIMLVSRGDRIVLARKKGWPEGRFSILAGFVEPGETLEGAVVREVMEEIGIPVTNVRYHSSQPWPFPSNLMMGYVAQAESDTIRISDDELEEARWFHRDELIEEARAYTETPHSVSIARRLIAEWALGQEP
jgi:NAD+ diphosphatase